MLSAKEAGRETSERELEEIFKRIQKAIDQGKFDIFKLHYMSQPTLNSLRDLGYSVEVIETSKGEYYYISWY